MSPIETGLLGVNVALLGAIIGVLWRLSLDIAGMKVDIHYMKAHIQGKPDNGTERNGRNVRG